VLLPADFSFRNPESAASAAATVAEQPLPFDGENTIQRATRHRGNLTKRRELGLIRTALYFGSMHAI
jgi:hypothetical protein